MGWEQPHTQTGRSGREPTWFALRTAITPDSSRVKSRNRLQTIASCRSELQVVNSSRLKPSCTLLESNIHE